MLLFSGTNVMTCLDVVSLFYFIPIVVGKDHMVLTADKGVALVVMDRQEYIQKSRAPFEETNTYKPIPSDPTTKLKNKLINILKKIKAEERMDENTYRRIYPTGASAPKFYGLPKIHKRMFL